MGNGEWGMGNEAWGMGTGDWGLGNGEWGMGNGEWGMKNGDIKNMTLCAIIGITIDSGYTIFVYKNPLPFPVMSVCLSHYIRFG
jgi:hypothetical protein